MRSPVLTYQYSGISLRACYAMSGTDKSVAAISLRVCYAKSGDAAARGDGRISLCSYAMSGTDMAYDATLPLRGVQYWQSVCYEFAMLCASILLHACYGMSGTEIGCGAAFRWERMKAKRGTERGLTSILLRARYAMSGTDTADPALWTEPGYAAMGMVVPGAQAAEKQMLIDAARVPTPLFRHLCSRFVTWAACVTGLLTSARLLPLYWHKLGFCPGTDIAMLLPRYCHRLCCYPGTDIGHTATRRCERRIRWRPLSAYALARPCPTHKIQEFLESSITTTEHIYPGTTLLRAALALAWL
eukprot:3884177-Rhodomonas_salina.3